MSEKTDEGVFFLNLILFFLCLVVSVCFFLDVRRSTYDLARSMIYSLTCGLNRLKGQNPSCLQHRSLNLLTL